MIEGRRVVAGEAILSSVATIDGSEAERNRDGMLEALVREHSRLVYRIAYAVLRCHHDAEDATQETFVRVLRFSSKLAAVEDPKTWLARIAWRVAVDRSRRLGRKREIPLEDPERPVAEVASSEAPADETRLGDQISAMLEKLITALPGKAARAANPVDDRRNVASRSGRDVGNQRGRGAVASLPGTTDFAREAGWHVGQDIGGSWQTESISRRIRTGSTANSTTRWMRRSPGTPPSCRGTDSKSESWQLWRRSGQGFRSARGGAGA